MYNCLKESFIFKNNSIKEIPLVLDQNFGHRYQKVTLQKNIGTSKNKKIITLDQIIILNDIWFQIHYK